jgi:hypothetical protein
MSPPKTRCYLETSNQSSFKENGELWPVQFECAVGELLSETLIARELLVFNTTGGAGWSPCSTVTLRNPGGDSSIRLRSKRGRGACQRKSGFDDRKS